MSIRMSTGSSMTARFVTSTCGDRCRFIVFFDLLLVHIVVTFDEAILYPLDPYPVVGENFTLTCSLTDKYPYLLTSSFMFFSCNGSASKLPQTSSTIVVDERTIRLLITSVQIEHTGEYACNIDQKTIGRLNRMLRVTDVIVGKPPEPVVAINCVSDNWKDMHCSYCSTPANTASYAVYWLNDYSEYENKKKWNSCSSWSTVWSHSCSCHWSAAGDKTSFFHRLPYLIRVDVKNAWSSNRSASHARREKYIEDTSTIVKPQKVQGLKAVNVTSTTANVTWLRPKGLDPLDLVFEVLLNSDIEVTWSGQSNGSDNNVSAFEVPRALWTQILNLSPYTEYNACVRSRPTIGGYHSNCAHVRFSTQLAPPGAVSTDSILVSVINNSLIQVQWKRPQKINGLITLYRLKTWVGDKLVGNQQEQKEFALVKFNCDIAAVNVSIELTAANVDKQDNVLFGKPTQTNHLVYCIKEKRILQNDDLAIFGGLGFLLMILLVALIKYWRKCHKKFSVNLPQPRKNNDTVDGYCYDENEDCLRLYETTLKADAEPLFSEKNSSNCVNNNALYDSSNSAIIENLNENNFKNTNERIDLLNQNDSNSPAHNAHKDNNSNSARKIASIGYDANNANNRTPSESCANNSANVDPLYNNSFDSANSNVLNENSSNFENNEKQNEYVLTNVKIETLKGNTFTSTSSSSNRSDDNSSVSSHIDRKAEKKSNTNSTNSARDEELKNIDSSDVYFVAVLVEAGCGKSCDSEINSHNFRDHVESHESINCTVSTDSGTNDSGATDSGITDSGATDSGTTDSGTTDSETTDSGTSDSGNPTASQESNHYAASLPSYDDLVVLSDDTDITVSSQYTENYAQFPM